MDTQWFQDIDLSRPMDMRIYNLFNKRWVLESAVLMSTAILMNGIQVQKCSNFGRRIVYGFVRLVGIIER